MQLQQNFNNSNTDDSIIMSDSFSQTKFSRKQKMEYNRKISS